MKEFISLACRKKQHISHIKDIEICIQVVIWERNYKPIHGSLPRTYQVASLGQSCQAFMNTKAADSHILHFNLIHWNLDLYSWLSYGWISLSHSVSEYWWNSISRSASLKSGKYHSTQAPGIWFFQFKPLNLLSHLSLTFQKCLLCWFIVAEWHHRLDGHEFEWTPGDDDGQGGLACCNSWGHKESDTTERLNWTELNENLKKIMNYQRVISMTSIW